MAREESQPAPTSHGFFTTSAFATLAGATACIVIITNVIDGVFGTEYPKWIPLILSMAAAFAVYSYARMKRPASFKKTPVMMRLPIILLNGCLLYVTAFGVQAIAESETVTVVDASTPGADSTEETEATESRAASPRIAPRSLSSWSSIFSDSSSPTKLKREAFGKNHRHTLQR